MTNHIMRWRTAKLSSRIPTLEQKTPAPFINVCCMLSAAQFNFMEAEETGVKVPRRCKRCLSCTTCSFQGNGMSLKEFQELEELRSGVSYDPITKRVKVKYAYNNQVNLFQDNQAQAEKRAMSQEKSLVKKRVLGGV